MNRWPGPLLLFLSAVSTCALAQTQPGPGPALYQGVRPYTPPLPGGPAGNFQNQAPASAESEDVHLQFPNTDISVILKLYENLTGRQVVFDNTVSSVTVSIDIQKPVSRDEAIQIIETSLYLNGFAIVPTQGNIVKVLGVGKNPRQYGINIYSDVSQIPDDVAIVSVLFQLDYADSKDVKAVVDQYTTGSPDYASIPLPGALIVTESTVMLRNIAKIIAAADVPPAEVVSRFYPLQYANAKDVADQLNKLFEKSTQGGSTGGTSTAPIPRPLLLPNGQPVPPGSTQIPAALSGLTEDTIIVGKIKVDADERTNRIHVVTRPANLRFIEDLIAEYDSDLQFGEPVKRPLKYVDAGDILDVIVKAITEPGEKAEETTEGGAAASRQAEPTNSTTTAGGEGGEGGGTSGDTGGLTITPGLETPEKDITPKAVTIGNTKIIADPRENTIIVLGNDEVKRKIFTLLDQLDVRAPQVMLSTVIGEFTLNNDSNFGIDYLLHYPSGPLANLLSGTSGSSLGSTSFLNGNAGAAVTQFTGAPIASTLGTAIGAGTGFTAAIGAANSLDVIVNALESTGRFHVTNTPMVFASNNKKAIIVSGEEIAIPTSTLSNLTSTTGVVGSTAAVQSSIDYKQVALQLEVVPLINSDREVTLDILQKLDSPSGATQNVGGSLIPTITTRYLKTNVSVPNKATIVLGGLITRTVGGSSSALPFLGRIPVLGYLFGNKTKQSDRSELIILIRPVVSENPAEMADESHVERNRMLIEPDIDSTISPHESEGPKGVNFRYEVDDKQTQ